MQRSVRPDRPLGAAVLDTIRAVSEPAATAGIQHMLVGATARDILLTHVFDMPTPRATYDLDFAVAVADWDEFERLKAHLAARPGFTVNERSPHRLHYRSGDGPSYPIDLVPFGDIASADGEIAWPPDMRIMMSVVGYEEVLAASDVIALAPDLSARVASLPGLAVLKLIAWSDRGASNAKDAHDLLHLLSTYHAAGNEARLYDTEYALLEAAGHDPGLAGAQLLGRDVAQFVTADTLLTLTQLLDTRTVAIVRAMVGSIRHRENAQEQAELSLRQFRRGLSAE